MTKSRDVRHPGQTLTNSIHQTYRKAASFVELIRPHHAAKNLIILVPWVVAGSTETTTSSLMAFAAFCAIAMAVYAFNDALDAAHDANHTRKRFRPIPSGRVSKPEAFVVAAVFLFLSIYLSLSLSPLAFYIVLAYATLNFFYSLVGKCLPMIDVVIVAAGFVLRLYMGLVVSNQVENLSWLLGPVFLFTLCLAIGKRFAKLGLKSRSGDHNVPVFYTETRTIWLMIAISQFAIGVTAALTIENWTRLNLLFSLSNTTFVVSGMLAIAILTQALVRMLVNRTEPIDIFTRDPFVVAASIATVSIITIDRFT